MKHLKTFEQTTDKSLITNLNLSNEGLTELPDLSEYVNLETLYCYNNQLTSLPELPKTLERLDCSNNKLTSLPELPKTLERLDCSNNKLISLPELTTSLVELYCYNNQLTSLPDLPDLEELYCHNNKLTSLPELPDSLKDLSCEDNQLPFIDLYEYKEWYEKNKHLIDKYGLEYTYEILNKNDKYNL